jgi:hypothetical protein
MLQLFFNNLDKPIKTDQNNNNIGPVYSYSTNSIQIKLSHFDLRIDQLSQLNSFLWSNYAQLSQTGDLPGKLEVRLNEYLNEQIMAIKTSCFGGDEEAIKAYLDKKKFNSRLLGLADSLERQYPGKADSFRCLLNVVVQGCVLAYLFSPCEPLDPFEYELLVKKCADDVEEIEGHERCLEEFNSGRKLRGGEFCESKRAPEEETDNGEFYFERSNQSEYFFIKNELESGLAQFGSYERVGRMVEELFRVHVGSGQETAEAKKEKGKSLVEEEYRIWSRSVEKFSERMMERFCSFADVVYVPLNGLALVGYGVKAIYTRLR